MVMQISLAEATVLRNTALAALQKAIASKAINAEGMMTQRNDINHLREQFVYWDEFCAYLKGMGTSMTYRNLIPGEV